MTPLPAPPPIVPSGAQFELVHGVQRAVVVEFGGGLREYTVAGRPVLDGYAIDERCTSGRGQLLIPWPNRLRDGRYEWEGESLQLALSEPEKHNAIHGLVRRATWYLVEQSEHRVVLGHVIYPRDGYPFSLSVNVEYVLDERGLSVTTSATNVGGSPCPYGVGAHPYLTVGTETIDSCTLQAPGGTWMPADERAIPIEARSVEQTEYDFRSPRPIDSVRLDTAFGELARDPDGMARVSLATADGANRVTLWSDESYAYLMLFTGDSLPDPSRRRRGLGVEPMTCAPNAFQSGAGLRRLEPGDSFSCTWGIEPALAPS